MLAVRNAGRFLKESGAQSVKLEGGERTAPAIERIVEYADGWLPILMDGFDERLAQLNALCEERGRDRSEIDVTVYGMVDSADRLAELQAQGINRLVLGLPTVAEDEALKVMDGYANIVEWAAQLD